MAPPKKICPHYLVGRCFHGAKCGWRHDVPQHDAFDNQAGKKADHEAPVTGANREPLAYQPHQVDAARRRQTPHSTTDNQRQWQTRNVTTTDQRYWQTPTVAGERRQWRRLDANITNDGEWQTPSTTAPSPYASSMRCSSFSSFAIIEIPRQS
ncbi:hypothetical protein BJ546DRAFT_987962 [Cryomyces antarcticus]